MEAYCLKCRTKREMQDAKQVTMKNGKPASQGKCPVCGTTMYKIGGAPGASTADATKKPAASGRRTAPAKK